MEKYEYRQIHLFLRHINQKYSESVFILPFLYPSSLQKNAHIYNYFYVIIKTKLISFGQSSSMTFVNLYRWWLNDGIINTNVVS